MSNTNLCSSWTKLNPPPDAFYTECLLINDNEFVIVPHKDGISKKGDGDGIYKYNATIKCWNKIMDYPKDFVSFYQSATIDKDKQIIYTCSDVQFTKINLNTKDITKVSNNYPMGYIPGIIFENGNVHIIGGNFNNKHYIFDETKSEFKLICDFGHDQNVSPESFYFKRNKSIITPCYKRNNKENPVSIMEFKNNKWTDWNIGNCEYLAASKICATTNEDYLIFITGFDFKLKDYHQFIFVYNVRNHKLIKSDIEAPLNYDACPVITRNGERDNLLTVGFINYCYKMEEFKDVQAMPFYLIKLIGEWVYFETLHALIGEDLSRTHWIIDVDKIIASILNK